MAAMAAAASASNMKVWKNLPSLSPYHIIISLPFYYYHWNKVRATSHINLRNLESKQIYSYHVVPEHVATFFTTVILGIRILAGFICYSIRENGNRKTHGCVEKMIQETVDDDHGTGKFWWGSIEEQIHMHQPDHRSSFCSPCSCIQDRIGSK